jgi:ACR3 family arsenite efflux pump ArsB
VIAQQSPAAFTLVIGQVIEVQVMMGVISVAAMYPRRYCISDLQGARSD